jgi:hypothetical protein
MQASNRKNKIVLADYNYKKDIQNRLLMASLSNFEVDVLKEIVNSSLKTNVHQLAEALECGETELILSLDKLGETKLFLKEGSSLFVDKELRKYFESQLAKFDENFEPGFDFFQGLLNKIPPSVLPNWYGISRTSDHIFHSIIEKYLVYPKIYERYLIELQVDYQKGNDIVKDLFKSPDLKLRASDIMLKHQLTPAQFEECVLHLEFGMICCLCYEQTEDRWEEVITPYMEWKEYLRYKQKNTPKSLENPKDVTPTRSVEFSFISDMVLILENLSEKARSKEEILKLLPSETPQSYFETLVHRLLSMDLISQEGNLYLIKEDANEWLDQPINDQAASIYSHLMKQLSTSSKRFDDKDFREIEKSLKKLTHAGWIHIDDFLSGFSSAIATTDPVMLKAKGKKWRYAIPEYTKEELTFIRETVLSSLYQIGITNTGTYKNEPCFCVTPFGRLFLED